MINVDEIYGKVLQSVVSSIRGYEQNFTEEEENAYVRVNYNITSEGGVQQQFNWLLTKGQTSVRPPEEFASWVILNPSLEELTGITEDSFEVPNFEVPTLPTSITPQPEVPKPSIISIDFDQLNPLTIPTFFGGEGGRENPQLGSSTSRGGVLGGRNFSNPQDAIENEFRFRTRITNRER
jgi:hypothetical protein